jgi:hypothetical protein
VQHWRMLSKTSNYVDSVGMETNGRWNEERYLGGMHAFRGAGCGATAKLCRNCELGLHSWGIGIAG